VVVAVHRIIAVLLVEVAVGLLAEMVPFQIMLH